MPMPDQYVMASSGIVSDFRCNQLYVSHQHCTCSNNGPGLPSIQNPPPLAQCNSRFASRLTLRMCLGPPYMHMFLCWSPYLMLSVAAPLIVCALVHSSLHQYFFAFKLEAVTCSLTNSLIESVKISPACIIRSRCDQHCEQLAKYLCHTDDHVIPLPVSCVHAAVKGFWRILVMLHWLFGYWNILLHVIYRRAFIEHNPCNVLRLFRTQ